MLLNHVLNTSTSLSYFDKVCNHKNIPPLAVAGIAAGASAIGSIASRSMGMSGSGKKMNWQYNYNKMLMENEVNANKDLFDYQNRYNLPANQIARMRAAGINPYMALGQMDAGNGHSIGSVSGSGVSIAPNEQQSFGRDLIDAAVTGINTYLNEQLQQQEVRKSTYEGDLLEIQTRYAEDKEIQELQELIKSNEARGIDNKINQERLDDLVASRDERRASQKSNYNKDLVELDMAKVDSNIKSIELEMQNQHLKALPQNIMFDLATKAEYLQNLKLNGRLTEAQQTKALAEAFKASAEANGQEISNRVAKESADSLIRYNNAMNNETARRAEQGYLPTDKTGASILGTGTSFTPKPLYTDEELKQKRAKANQKASRDVARRIWRGHARKYLRNQDWDRSKFRD